MIIDNKENHHVVGVGFTAYAINVNIGVKTATKNAATKATYKTVWVAGPSIEFTKEILPVKTIVERLTH